MKLLRLFCSVALFCLVLSPCTPASPEGGPGTSGNETFHIIILARDWYDLKLGHTYDKALPLLTAAAETDRLITLTTGDIERYAWTGQIITLTNVATERLISSLPEKEAIKKHILSIEKFKKKRGWGNRIEMPLHLKGFIVKVGNDVLYGGIFIEPMSELSIDYPVIRPALANDRAVLHLLPVHIPFVSYDPVVNNGGEWNKAISPEGAEIWDHFPPPMKSRFMEMGLTGTASRFRNVLRDPRVRAIMEKARVVYP